MDEEKESKGCENSTVSEEGDENEFGEIRSEVSAGPASQEDSENNHCMVTSEPTQSDENVIAHVENQTIGPQEPQQHSENNSMVDAGSVQGDENNVMPGQHVQPKDWRCDAENQTNARPPPQEHQINGASQPQQHSEDNPMAMLDTGSVQGDENNVDMLESTVESHYEDESYTVISSLDYYNGEMQVLIMSVDTIPAIVNEL